MPQFSAVSGCLSPKLCGESLNIAGCFNLLSLKLNTREIEMFHAVRDCFEDCPFAIPGANGHKTPLPIST